MQYIVIKKTMESILLVYRRRAEDDAIDQSKELYYASEAQLDTSERTI